jgi:2-dehydropantoate 2-reductase
VKVAIVGAGAIGGFLGVRFAQAGADVSLVARGAHLAAMRTHGVRLQFEGNEEVAHVRCTDDPGELGPQDYVVIALKAHQITDAVGGIAQLLGPKTAVVTSSNGLPYWYFHRAAAPFTDRVLETVDPGGEQWRCIGPERAIGCVVFPATEVIAPGIIHHDHGRKFPLGEPSGQSTERIERLSALFAAGGLDAPIRTDIRDEIWLKLWGNLCLNPISALTRATVGIVATDPGARSACRAMMTEAAAIAERIGVHLRVDMERRLDGAAALGAHKMSMLQDLERGRSMEIEPMVGAVQELGRLTGVPTPAVDIVLALIRVRARTASSAA